MKIKEKECATCGKEIEGYWDQNGPQIWNKSSRDPSIGQRKCVAVRDILKGEVQYVCIECWNKRKRPADKLVGMAVCHATKRVDLTFQAHDGKAVNGVKDKTTTHTIMPEDLIKVVEFLAEHDVIGFSVSVELGDEG